MSSIRLVFVAAFWLGCGIIDAAEPIESQHLQRIGHTDIWVLAKDDAPGNPHAYYSVRFVGDGLLAASSIWESPTIFRLDPQTGLCDMVSYFQPVKGNEDNRRWSLRCDRTAQPPFLFWHVDGYEDLDGDLSNGNKDSAVFTAPLDVTKPFFSDVNVTTTNLPPVQTVGRGPTQRGIAYDQSRQLLFTTVSAGKNPDRDDILQAFRFDRASGSLRGRVQVFEPVDDDATQFSFVDCDPQHRLVMFGGGLRWQTHGARVYLAQYSAAPNESASCAMSDVQRRSQLRLAGTESMSSLLQDPRSAAFIERAGRVWAIVGSGRFDRTPDPRDFSDGLWTFDLGPIGGPYELGQPVARVPFDNPVEHLVIDGERLLVSSFGVHVFRLDDVLAAKGLAANTKPIESLALPYRTHELDLDRVGEQRLLVVAAGQSGFDVFRSVTTLTSRESSPVPSNPRRITINDRQAEVLLETNDTICHFGAPSLAENGDLAVWAVLADGHEAILTCQPTAARVSWRVVVKTGDRFRTLGTQPAIATADDLACWASRADGSQVILRCRAGQVTEVATSRDHFRRLDPPRLSQDGRILFGAEPLASRYSLFEPRDGRFVPLLPESPPLFFKEEIESFCYDISPDGIVAFIAQTDLEDWATAGAYLIEDARVVPITGRTANQHRDIGAQRHIRAIKGGDIAMQSFVDELVAFRTIPRDGSQGTLIRHRSAEETGLPLAYVQHGMSNARGDSVFIASPSATNTEPGSQGNALYFVRRPSNHCELLCRTHDRVDASTIRHIQFDRAFNESRRVAATLRLRDPQQRQHQALIQLNVE